MKPLRVLQLGSPTGMYGAERWILALVKHLDPAEVESIVGVIVDEPGLEAPLLKHAAGLGFRTVAIEAMGRVNRAAVRRLREYLLREDIDVLHTHFYKSDLIGLLATRGTRVKLVTTPHGWSTDAGPALKAYEALDRAAFRWFDAVVPLSDDLHAGLVGRAGPGLQLIRNGVDLGEIEAVTTPAAEAVAWRAAGEFVVGYVGQLIPRKGLDVLLRAFGAAELPSGRLVLVGEGPQRGDLVTLARQLGIAPRTEFLGFREDRLALLKGFDVFVLPSRLEGIPRCLMESMAAGVPIVVSDIPGSRDLIGPGPTGLVFPMDDVAALASRLTECVPAATRRQLAEAGRRFVHERYSATAMATAYARLFRALAAATPGGAASKQRA